MKEEFYGRCLLGKKRHYFGRNTGWAGGWGIPWTYKCVWCGKYNPKWEPKFWEEDKKEEEKKKKVVGIIRY